MYRRVQLSSTVIALLSVTPPIAAQVPADTSSHLSSFVSVEGVRVHYLDWRGSGSAMVFVPGAGHTAHVFDDFALAVGVVGDFGWVFALPWPLMGLTALLVIALVAAWRHGFWSVPMRVHFSMVAFASVAFMAFIAYWPLF